MFNWMKKKLGYHVCEEFTQWKAKQSDFMRTNVLSGVVMSQYQVSRYWQERQCVICGKIQQEELDNPSDSTLQEQPGESER